MAGIYDTNYFLNQMNASVLNRPREVIVKVPVSEYTPPQGTFDPSKSALNRPYEPLDPDRLQKVLNGGRQPAGIPEVGRLVWITDEGVDRSAYFTFAKNKLYRMIFESKIPQAEISVGELKVKRSLAESQEYREAALVSARNSGLVGTRYLDIATEMALDFVDLEADFSSEFTSQVLKASTALSTFDYATVRPKRKPV